MGPENCPDTSPGHHQPPLNSKTANQMEQSFLGYIKSDML